jgi:hypothetical protein
MRSLEARKNMAKKKEAVKYKRCTYSELGVNFWRLDCITEMDEAH